MLFESQAVLVSATPLVTYFCQIESTGVRKSSPRGGKGTAENKTLI